MSSRKAALLVHALGDGDRAWLLGQLDPAERQRLQSLLGELGTLGIPEDPTLVDLTLARTPAPSAAPAPSDDAEHVSMAAPHRIAQALRPEPTAFVRKLLACEDWPWRDEVAAQLALPALGSFDSTQALGAASFRRHATRLLAERLRQNGAETTPVHPTTKRPDTQRSGDWRRRLPALWGKSA
jgi:hypothetical protein